MKKITFLHTADLHLDSPMVGLSHLPEKIYNRLLNSTFLALKKLVDTAIEKKVDFVVIAGDVYDGEDRSIRAQIRFRKEMVRLEENEIPVYLVHGNHDHLSGTWTNIPLPENVTVFGEEVEYRSYCKENVSVHVYGFSYNKRQIVEKKTDYYLKKAGADFHIGILHGNDGASSSHGNYAPFLVKELIDKEFDYWALGHIHKSKILCESPPIVYPGNIQGRHYKESGPKGCYLVTLTENHHLLEWIDTADVEWGTLELDTSNCHSFQEIYQLCIEKINNVRQEQPRGKIIQLVLDGVQPFSGIESIVNGELLEILQENERDELNFIWISSIEVKENFSYDREILKGEGGFYRELLQTIENFHEINLALEPLFIHPLGRKHIEVLSRDEENNLITEAERILVQLLYEKKEGGK